MRPPLKIVHTADLHLGAKFTKLGAKGAGQRKRLCEVLVDITDLALRERADFVLFAGDTFDHHQPAPQSLSAFEFAVARLAQAGIPVLLIAGTHDFLNGRSILKKYLADQAEGPILLHSRRPVWKSAEKQAVIQGVSLERPDSPARPLAGLHRTEDPGWQIGMIHASLEIGQETTREAVFSPAEVQGSGLDYLALGHWHRMRDCSAGQTTCWYPGAPEMIAMDEEEKGRVLVVELRESTGPRVTPVTVGKRSLLRVNTEVSRLEEALHRAMLQVDPDRILELTLSGMMPPGQPPDIREIQNRLAGEFFFVEVRNSAVSRLSAEEMLQYPEQTVIGRFIRLVEERQKKAEPAQKEQLEQALQLGLALLSGREVLPWS
ncbi:DNA repair exonuclease [candidate division FCPU426 bacterium]|nr:DNA repair exonuclease [candidate division FCPU426 bacterium]